MNDKSKLSFKEFRSAELPKYECPDPKNAKNWQEERAIVLRKHYIEEQIKSSWKKLNE